MSEKTLIQEQILWGNIKAFFRRYKIFPRLWLTTKVLLGLAVVGLLIFSVNSFAENKEAEKQKKLRTWQLTSAEVMLPDGRKAPWVLTESKQRDFLLDRNTASFGENQMVLSFRSLKTTCGETSYQAEATVTCIITWSRRQ